MLLLNGNGMTLNTGPHTIMALSTFSSALSARGAMDQNGAKRGFAQNPQIEKVGLAGLFFGLPDMGTPPSDFCPYGFLH